MSYEKFSDQELNDKVDKYASFIAEGIETEINEQILEDLQKDPWPVPNDKRPSRSTGAALSVATSMLQLAIPRR